MRELTAREAMSLRRIVVEDNQTVTGIEISMGTTGMGGSNCSDDLEDRAEVYSLEELRKSKPIHLWWGEELCAVIGDRFYLRSRENKTLTAYGEEGKYILGEKVAYDTAEYQKVRLIYREE